VIIVRAEGAHGRASQTPSVCRRGCPMRTIHDAGRGPLEGSNFSVSVARESLQARLASGVTLGQPSRWACPSKIEPARLVTGRVFLCGGGDALKSRNRKRLAVGQFGKLSFAC
jgi:hypothetical protein